MRGEEDMAVATVGKVANTAETRCNASCSAETGLFHFCALHPPVVYAAVEMTFYNKIRVMIA